MPGMRWPRRSRRCTGSARSWTKHARPLGTLRRTAARHGNGTTGSESVEPALNGYRTRTERRSERAREWCGEKGLLMARAIWSGFISFGLVSVPVGLYSATEEHELDFHQFQRGTSDRIRYKRVNARTGREVDYDKIVKGHDVGGGEYVIVEQEELADIAPGRSRTLQISEFVDLDEIDPIHFQKSYYLAPGDAENASSYGLLRDALAKTN